MDVNMPIMDGVEATKIIKKNIKEGSLLPCWILAITAAQNTSENEIKNFHEVGFDGIYQKPVSKQTFLSILEKFK